jgi:hypothetical protein
MMLLSEYLKWGNRVEKKGMGVEGSVSDPDWIRIQAGQWIRIRIRNPDPDPVTWTSFVEA